MAANPPTSTFDPVASRVRVEVEAADELQKWLDKAGRGDFVVRLEERLDENVQVEVVVAAGELEFPMRCRVKQVFRSGRDRYGTMVEWLDREGAAQAELAEEPLESRVEMASGAFDVPMDSPTPSGELPLQQAPGEPPKEAPAEVEPPRPADAAPFGATPAPESSTGVPKLTRKLPKTTDDHSRLFDVSALNPDQDESSPVQEDPRSARSARVAEADRHAQELEALLSESGRWTLEELGVDGTVAQTSDASQTQPAPDVAEAANGELEPESAVGGAAAEDSAENGGSAGGPVEEGAEEGEAIPPDDRTPEAKQAVEHDETRGVSLAHRIRQMNPNEKARLAARGGRQERRLLLRDHTFTVQMGLLNNPRTEIKEILEIAKNPQTTGGILKRLATDRKYTGNYEVQLALVKHPGTPTPLAIRLLELLRISDLRTLAKSQAIRENVRKAALRLYLQRSP